MAKHSKSRESDEDAALSNGSSSSEDQQINYQVNEDDQKELEAVARSAASEEDVVVDEDGNDEVVNVEISKREKARLREMQNLKEQKIRDILDAQNAAIDADVNNKGKGRLKYLLQQIEIFAHFSKGDQSSSQKKAKGRGRHASKLTEEEEDAEYLKEEGDGLSNSHLVTQPLCIQGKMRDYQLAGLNWLIRLYENGINGILADGMGLGKTLQTISLMGYLHEYRGITGPYLVVAPESTLGNWMNEFRCFCPVLRAAKFLGNPDEQRHILEELLVAEKFDVCVTSFEMAIKESALRNFSWLYIIIDEAHRIKNENPLSETMRLYNTNYRLLITGTPLQNNLHELWSLLNLLLPEIFGSAETFDERFQISGENDQQEVIQQLHKVLRPFLLRRLKSDVEKGLPPKRETILKVGMSQMQKQRYRDLLQKDLEVVNAGGECKRLLSIAMQLRKCCNHPYLFQGAEPGPPYTTGDHLITNAGKMVLLDKLLPKLKDRDSRVLIFSQMTRLLDILEDYLMLRGYQYCRIDGNSVGEDQDASIEDFNKPGSEKFVFLLSTRAGGPGINLATADVVIFYDSNGNPQVDLQAQDHAHRIGQKKEVQVFRFCTEYTIEEKVIERAYKKLALDALVFQQGRLAERKTVNKDELLEMVRFGAEMVSRSMDCTITDEDIDRIIAKGEEATAELGAKMKNFAEDAIKFKMDDTAEVYDFDDEKAEKRESIPESISVSNRTLSRRSCDSKGVIEEILLRLPVRSLAKFKCVQKLWLGIINDHVFAIKHMNKTKRIKAILCTEHLYDVDFNDGDRVVAVCGTEVPYDNYNPIEIICSCHGIVCFKIRHNAYIYNPSIKKCEISESISNEMYLPEGNLYGLGYVESEDDYNFVILNHCHPAARVYSFKNDTWSFPKITTEGLFNSEGVFLNSAIHWLSSSHILVFDLKSKMMITQPVLEGMNKKGYRCLNVLEGNLCVAMELGGVTELWMMTEYGNRTSWSLKMKIASGVHPLKPLCFLNSDTMVWFVRQDLRVVVTQAENENDGEQRWDYEMTNEFMDSIHPRSLSGEDMLEYWKVGEESSGRKIRVDGISAADSGSVCFDMWSNVDSVAWPLKSKVKVE